MPHLIKAMVIVIQCKDKVGLVASITQTLAKAQVNIVSMREHVDTVDNRFYVRIVADGHTDTILLQRQLKDELPEEAMVILNPLPEKKIVVLVTKEYHCLSDILVRNHFKTLGATVQGVIGNHPTLQNICERFDIPFHLVSHEHKDKDFFEKELLDIIFTYQPDYLILAKFMRILSPRFVQQFPIRIINIHHSFLPAFMGSNPYWQAFERGVKLIGATAHFVTDALDEGPIIAQQTIPVNHSYTTSDMVKAGKEIETAVLSRALHLLFDDKVLVYGNKTVVFE